MKIYMDVCCLCRPFDDHRETRIRLETEAILSILKRCSLDWELVMSTAILHEIGMISDPRRKGNILQLTDRSHEMVLVDNALLSRAEEIEKTGVMGMDAVHIACAEKAGAILLTTDDELIRIMKKNVTYTSIQIDNPLHWLIEVNPNGN